MTPEQRALVSLFGSPDVELPTDQHNDLFYFEDGEISYSDLVKRYQAEGVERKGDWMQTALGRQFWPIDPRPEEVHIEDIAHALGMLCRYGGQCLRFYSVAEHCVHMANHAPPELAFAALMHDASEAYLCDVIRPIKSHLTNYLEIEAGLERVIAERFGLTWPMPAEVKRMDTAILADERNQVMAPPPIPWPQTTELPLGVTLQFWPPHRAKMMFLDAFRRFNVNVDNS